MGGRTVQREEGAARASSLVGRDDEIAVLARMLDEDGPRIVWVHGLAGIGKSTLLDAFRDVARGQGTTVIALDCRSVEPTENGFLGALSSALGAEMTSVPDCMKRLSRLGDVVVLSFDTYEALRLLDPWIREAFVPALPDNMRIILAAREAPLPVWWRRRGWEAVFRTLELPPLEEDASRALLRSVGFSEEEARQMNSFTRGHPLALRVATLAAGRGGADLAGSAIERVIEELSHLYLADLDRDTRAAVGAAALVRRTTVSVMGAMLPDRAPHDVIAALRELPFVRFGRDGLTVHDAIQQAVAAHLLATDPAAHRQYRKAAWKQLRTELAEAAPSELWRYTADMLYLIQNPVVREAFFPSGSAEYFADPSHPSDEPEIFDIIDLHEGPASAKRLKSWWRRAPGTFRAIRNASGDLSGFYCLFDPAEMGRDWLSEDPVTRSWLDHLKEDPVPVSQRVLFNVRWLGRDDGEGPSPVQAACWLDVKRVYMEMRPNLRRLYTEVRDIEAFAPVVTKLGFAPLPDHSVEIDGTMHYAAVLDFGPASVDGWLSWLAGSELGVLDSDEVVDLDARELVVDGQRVKLTRLELEVFRYLQERAGRAVSRVSLLQDVWGYEYVGGSNVVDAIMLSLRKKLGSHATMIETVRGVGYRLRQGDASRET